MPDIFHDFTIKVSPDRVFSAVSKPVGLDAWWTRTSSGLPKEGAEYELNFGPKYIWQARVTKCVAPNEFELEMFNSDPDWNGTRVGFHLTGDKTTKVSFRHTGWPAANDHWRISCYCWAMYLRILRRHLEHGESVPYEKRLDV
jgi:uncharacterized protein YndB with AHSA1/START domain